MAAIAAVAHISAHRQRLEEGMRLEFRLADARELVGICRLWKANRRRFGAPAIGVEERELRGDLDSAAAARIEMRIEHVGADVLVTVFD